MSLDFIITTMLVGACALGILFFFALFGIALFVDTKKAK